MEQTINIGGLGPLSAPGLVEAGRELHDSMALAVQHLNACGGVLGKSLKLLFEDTCGRAASGVAAVEKLGKTIHAFAGEYHSFVADAFLDRIERCGLPFVCASCTLDAITERRLTCVFRLAPPQSHGWRVYADFLAAEGFQHVVALEEESQYWRSGSKVIEVRLRELGIRFTRFSAPAGKVDPGLWVRQAQRLHPRPDTLLLLIGYPEPLRLTVNRAHSNGFGPPSCFFGDPAGRTAFPDWWQTLHTQGAHVPFLSYLRWDGLTPAGRRMVEEFQRQYGRYPTFVALEGYDSVLSIARAFTDAGHTNPQAVCDSLRQVTLEGTRGTIRFSTEPAGVVHQQWKWPPVTVVTYRQVPRQFGEAELLWDGELGLANVTKRLRALAVDGKAPERITSGSN